MGLLSRPVTLVEIYLAKYPASLGTRTLRLAKRPVSMVGRFYEPRLKSVSKFGRACTDPDGNYAVGSVTFVINDQDGFLAGLLAEGADTEYWLNREYAIWAISQEGIDAGLTTDDVQPVSRGWISSAQRFRRDVTVIGSDPLGSQMSRFNLDKKALRIAIKDLTDTPNEKTKDIKLPIYLGEFSDRGDGTPGSCLLPVYEVCTINITAPSTPVTPTLVLPPVITGSGVVGTTGQKTYYYAASVIIAGGGETALSNVVVVNGAISRNVSNYNWIEGTYDNGGSSPFNAVRVWRSESADPASFHLWLDEANYTLPGPGTWGYGDGAAPVQLAGGVGVTRDELDEPKEATPSAGGGATVDGIWAVMAVCLGYGYIDLDIGASDLAEGVEPTRALIAGSEHGATTITNQDGSWPFPNPWIEMNGIIFHGFLQRGPKLEHHRNGDVTMTVNLCGPHIGGLVLNQAWYQKQFLLNEYTLKNKGSGRTNETYGTLERYANGDPVIQTQSFKDCQELSMQWMEDEVGYVGNIWITDPEMTWRDVEQRFNLTFGGRTTSNRFGQIKAVLINTLSDSVTGRHFRERIEIKRSEEPLLAYDQIINKFLMSYFWDVAAGVYRGVDLPFTNDDSIAVHIPGGVIGGTDLRGLREQSRECAYTNDKATAYDSINRELIRRSRRPRYPSITVPMLGMDYDNGDRGRLTDTAGLGSGGDVATPVIILKHETDLDHEEITLTFQDLHGITVGTLEVGDEDDLSADEVGDEEAVPPTAVEVG